MKTRDVLADHPQPGHRLSGGEGCSFTAWAPGARSVDIRLISPMEKTVPMRRMPGGYWREDVREVCAGTRYQLAIDSRLVRPDPAAHSLPHGVHGPCGVVDHEAYPWRCDGFSPAPLRDLILYELHIGTFTPEGTFLAAAGRLDHLEALGVNAIEVMPVCQFPGGRNWGYDGVQPYSVQNTYGGPDGLKAFVDACHERGIAVVLDVVFNHLGPEGNYLRDFGPYFTDRHKTPWGEAVNLDGAYSDHVRAYFLHCLLHWLRRYRVDGFRLDATHALHDKRPDPFLRRIGELAETHRTAAGAKPLILAEDDLNDTRIASAPSRGGMGLTVQFSEDFHHCVHALATGERRSYYADFGSLGQLARVIRTGYAYAGEYAVSRQRSHGAGATRLAPGKIAVFIQNHDQTGNRAQGERLGVLIGFEASKAAAGLLLLSPHIPLLFMGEEYGEDNPFLYFVSHEDQALLEAVRKGRRQEFMGFHEGADPPYPAAPETFTRSILGWEKRSRGRHKILLDLYTHLIRLRGKLLRPSGKEAGRPKVTTPGKGGMLVLAYRHENGGASALFNLSPERRAVDFARLDIQGRKLVDSAETRWGGFGPSLPISPEGKAAMAPWSFGVYGALA